MTYDSECERLAFLADETHRRGEPMSLNPRYELRDGVMVVKPPEQPEPPEVFQLLMRHPDGAALDIRSEDYDALNFQRRQWQGEGYRLVRLEPVAPGLAA